MAPTTPTPTSTQIDTCSGPPLDYLIVRQQKIKEITDYYSKLLEEYTTNYTEYAKQSNSSNTNESIFANTTLKPKTEAYNKHIINLSKELINVVKTDNDLILEQKTELDKKSQNIDLLMSDIKKLKDKKISMKILEKSEYDSLNITKEGTEDLHFTTQIYMGINILLILLIIGLVIYLVYSNSTDKTDNTTTKPNNTATKPNNTAAKPNNTAAKQNNTIPKLNNTK